MDAKQTPAYVLATLVQRAASIRENSWDQARCDAARKDGSYIGREFYTKTYETAAKEACGEEHKDLVPVIDTWLFSCWNDALDWAEKITGVKPDFENESLNEEKRDES